MSEPSLRDDTNSRDTDRLEAFSDGVIAIAITLLIIEIGVPHLEEGDAGIRALLEELLLLCIAFIPFPTAVMAEYLGEPGQRTAVVFYGGAFTLTAVCYYLLWSYPTRGRRLVEPDTEQAAIDAIERRFRVGWPTYLGGRLSPWSCRWPA